MKTYKIILYMSIISIFFSSLIISTIAEPCEGTTQPPSIIFQGAEVTFNVSYIEENIVALNNNSYFSGFDVSIGHDSFSLHFWDNLTGLLVRISGESDCCGEVTISNWSYDVSHSSFNYKFSNATEELLLKIISPDVTNVLDYIKTTTFTSDYNEFYTFDITGAYPDLDWLDEYKKIDDTWYLASHSFEPYSRPLFDEFTITFSIFTILSLTMVGFFGLKYKKTKKKRYIIGVISGILLAVIFLLMIYLWLSAQVAI